MKTLAALVIAVAALALAGAAQAGCFATVGLNPLPLSSLQAGEPWTVTIRVLQHGRTPLAGAKPEVRIRNRTGAVTAFRAKPLARRGSYLATVVFPAAGRWTYRVFDGFVPNCAREHSFAAITVAAG